MEFEIAECNPNSQFDCLFVKDITTFSSIDANPTSYASFFENFMLKNIPCIITNIGANWKATKEWINTEGQPNLNHMEAKYGQTNVMIYNCSERYFNSQKCEESTLSHYLKLNEQHSTNALYYLKDWHLKLQCKSDDFYEVPIFFASDWLNEYLLEHTNDDYRFVYMGQKDTWTPLHTDVFNSYSWSVNVCGQKKWVFFPPDQKDHLQDTFDNIVYDVDDIAEQLKTIKHFMITQNPGEAVFVPSGWYHQVWNLQSTISVNHNWVNGCNIRNVWEEMKNNLEKTRLEIADCKDMDNFNEHCQIMLKALFGMNYKQFFDLLKFIANKRLDMKFKGANRTLFHGHILGHNHIEFDLRSIGRVLEYLLKDKDVAAMSWFDEGCLLLDTIKQL